MKHFYVTFKTAVVVPSSIGFPQVEVRFDTERIAIDCPDEESMIDCAKDIYSYDGISNLRLNRCGKLRKGVRIISYDDYKSGKSI